MKNTGIPVFILFFSYFFLTFSVLFLVFWWFLLFFYLDGLTQPDRHKPTLPSSFLLEELVCLRPSSSGQNI